MLISWDQLTRTLSLHMQLELLNIFQKQEKPNNIETNSPPEYKCKC